MLARRFLWVVAGLVVLVLIGAIVYRLFGNQLLRFTMVPSVPFENAPPAAPNAYARADMWLARPGMRDDPSLWTPPGTVRPSEPARASIFFIHPTSYLEKKHWNAPLGDKESQWRARLFVRSEASVFNGIGRALASLALVRSGGPHANHHIGLTENAHRRSRVWEGSGLFIALWPCFVC